jgi:hypothetical protein
VNVVSSVKGSYAWAPFPGGMQEMKYRVIEKSSNPFLTHVLFVKK